MSRYSFFIAATLATIVFLALVAIVTFIGGHNNGLDALTSDPLIVPNPFVETAIAGTSTAIAKTPTATPYNVFTVIAASATAKAQTATPIPTPI